MRTLHNLSIVTWSRWMSRRYWVFLWPKVQNDLQTGDPKIKLLKLIYNWHQLPLFATFSFRAMGRYWLTMSPKITWVTFGAQIHNCIGGAVYGILEALQRGTTLRVLITIGINAQLSKKSITKLIPISHVNWSNSRIIMRYLPNLLCYECVGIISWHFEPKTRPW